MKEYQRRKERGIVLPSAVYHQCIWVVKDMDRLQTIARCGFAGEMLAEEMVSYGEVPREAAAYGSDVVEICGDKPRAAVTYVNIVTESEICGGTPVETAAYSGATLEIATCGNTAVEMVPAISPEQEEAMFKLDCIHHALLLVPEEYREGILYSIRNRGSGYYDFAHENTWKKWKQRFIYALAVNLRLVSPQIY
jgi:hypothetical protein